MKNNDELKKIIESAGDSNSQDVIELLSHENELAGFLSKLSLVKKNMEPDRLLTLKILDTIKNIEKEKALKPGFKLLGFEKIRIQLNMSNILKFTIPTALAVLVGIVFLANPFSRENSQINELREIGGDEQTINGSVSGLNSYINEESQLSQLDSALMSAKELAPSSQNSFFDIDSISSESDSIKADLEFSAFISQENSLNDVYSNLNNF